MTGMFQSAPHFSSEANFAVRLFRAFLKDVSIRASLQQRGEHGGRPGQWRRRAVSIRASLQQRGERRHPLGALLFRQVSIRASLQQRGEQARARQTRIWFSSFNPRLTSAARRTDENSSSKPITTRFNPRLTSAARRTRPKRAEMILMASFNPRLTSAARRTMLADSKMYDSGVSIRASLQQRGEQRISKGKKSLPRFQSAPHFSRQAKTCLPSQKQTKTEFQSAPHFSSEANSASNSILSA